MRERMRTSAGVFITRGRHRRLLRLIAAIFGVVFVYVGLEYTYMLVERPAEADFTLAIWYVALNPTRLGFGTFMPTTLGGRLVGLTFTAANVLIMAAIFGKAAEIFNEIRNIRRRGHLGTRFSDHYVILGWDSFGRLVAEQLVDADQRIAIVTNERTNVEHIYDHFSSRSSRGRRVNKNVFVVHMAYESVELLRHANLSKAHKLFINVGTGTDALIALLNIQKEFPEVSAVARIDNEDLIDTFERAGFESVISNYSASAKLTASYIFEPEVADFAQDMLATARGDDDYDVQQYRVSADCQFLGQIYEEVYFALYELYGCVLLGRSTNVEDNQVLEILPEGPSATVNLGDYLMVVVNGQTVETMQQLFGGSSGTK